MGCGCGRKRNQKTIIRKKSTRITKSTKVPVNIKNSKRKKRMVRIKAINKTLSTKS